MQQQKLCNFKLDAAMVQVAIRTYGYVPLRLTEPIARRRMLRHKAIEALVTTRKTDRGRCPLPVRCLANNYLLNSAVFIRHLSQDRSDSMSVAE